MEGGAVDARIQELRETKDLALWLQRHEPEFRCQSVAQALTELYRARDLSKAELSRRSDVSLVYLHQVFGGRRTPSRDRLLGLCLGLQATLDETQTLLQTAGYAPLRLSCRRDAVVLYAILRGLPLMELRELLERFGETALY